jgi:hypothetical protein
MLRLLPTQKSPASSLLLVAVPPQDQAIAKLR